MRRKTVHMIPYFCLVIFFLIFQKNFALSQEKIEMLGLHHLVVLNEYVSSKEYEDFYNVKIYIGDDFNCGIDKKRNTILLSFTKNDLTNNDYIAAFSKIFVFFNYRKGRLHCEYGLSGTKLNLFRVIGIIGDTELFDVNVAAGPGGDLPQVVAQAREPLENGINKSTTVFVKMNEFWPFLKKNHIKYCVAMGRHLGIAMSTPIGGSRVNIRHARRCIFGAIAGSGSANIRIELWKNECQNKHEYHIILRNTCSAEYGSHMRRYCPPSTLNGRVSVRLDDKGNISRLNGFKFYLDN